MSHENNNENEQPIETGRSAELPAPEGPRIYLASLSDYNAGIVHGTWLDATAEINDLWAGVNEMLATSPTTKRYGEVAEEWAIHDYEGFGRYVALGEYEPLEQVHRLATGIVAHGPAYEAWWAMEARSDADEGGIEVQFEEQYLGEFSSLEEYGEQMLAEMGIDPDDLRGVPEGLRPYVRINVEAWTRDMEYGGEISTVESESGVYVFWNV